MFWKKDEYEEATVLFAVWACDYWEERGYNATWVAEVEQIYPEKFYGVVLLGLAAATGGAAYRLDEE